MEASCFELALHELGIACRRIRVGTLRYNDRVESQQGLYIQHYDNQHRFLSLADLRRKLADYITYKAFHVSTSVDTFTLPVKCLPDLAVDSFIY